MLEPEFTVAFDGFMPSSPAAVYLMSNPVLLGQFTVGPDGRLVSAMRLPATISAGVHTLQVSGYSQSGEVLSLSIGVDVRTSAAVSGPARASLYFAYSSAKPENSGRAQLRPIVAQAKAAGSAIKIVSAIRSVGASARDMALAKARSANTAKVLRALGFRGAIRQSVRKMEATGASKDRRVTVSLFG